MKKINWIILIIISVISGFIGGWFFKTALHTEIDKELLKIYISWPPIVLFLVLLFLVLFYRQISKRLENGGIRIKWGDKEIYLTEFQSKFETDLGSIIDERIELALLDCTDRKDDKTNKVGIDLLKYHLENSKFKWRTLKTLTKRTALSAEQIEELVQTNPQQFVRSINKDNDIIYKLKSK